MPSSTPLRRHVACLAGGFTGAGRFDDLADDDLAQFGRSTVVARQLADNVADQAAPLDTNLSLVSY
jgi:hypothetical protein